MQARARGLVELVQSVERAKIDAQGAVEALRDPRLDATDDAGPAAVRDHRDVRARRPLEQRLDFGLVARASDEVGRVLVLAAEGADRVEVRLAVGVGGALLARA